MRLAFVLAAHKNRNITGHSAINQPGDQFVHHGLVMGLFNLQRYEMFKNVAEKAYI